MRVNHLKTLWGYLKTRLGMMKKSRSSADIYNYVAITDTLATSGQPGADEFGLIKQAGYDTVINLAPSHADNAIANEAGVVAQQGLQYVHIPVDFKQPTEQDFDQFCQAMQQSAKQKVWVHCAANMRVSAFIYRYRRDVLGEAEAVAANDLEKIWQPYGVWKQFLSRD